MDDISPPIDIDQRLERTNTVSGFWLALLIAARALIVAFVISAVAVILIRKSPQARPFAAIAIGTVGFSVAYILYALVGLISDYQKKKPLGTKYGCRIHCGVDQYQRRLLRVRATKEGLDAAILGALEDIGPGVVAKRTALSEFRATRPLDPLRQFRTLVTVTAEPDPNGETLVVVESRVDEPGLWFMRNDQLRFDLGRSIENVEEFQLALKRRLETSRLMRSSAGSATIVKDGGGV